MYYMNHYGNLRGLTFKQGVKDIWRGFVKGIKQRKFSMLDNHFMENYLTNLERWTTGEEFPQ